jgi:DNA gyrase subunit B
MTYSDQANERMVEAQEFNVIKVLEMNAEQLWETTMDPSFRTLRQVTIDSLAEADRVFSMLMETKYHQKSLLRKCSLCKY